MRSTTALTNDLAAANEKVDKLKLENLNLSSMLDTARDTVSKFEQLVDKVSQNEIPGLQQLFATAQRACFGIGGLLKRVQSALEGTYRPRNYTPQLYDLATLLYELGGAGAIYAVNHACIALPSLKTIQKQQRKFALRVTAGRVVVEDVMENITTLFGHGSGLETPNRPVGHTLALDEIAGDGRVCYLPKTDEMAGFCREHVHSLPTVKMGLDLSSVLAAAQAVKDGEVHIGKEFTVASISAHAEKNYGAKPVLISPTCKQGTRKDSEVLITTILTAWA